MDMQFGDVEEAGLDVQLRPDQNRHYAVVPVFDPDPLDLPIFVDIDVMNDMEFHALSDTTVELGGVMLGGQYEDDQGNPFVVVTDSLRAEHYEATKGSFKFTHETWQQISRQREQFPEELQMVGWYHTHPDWGVFLSGMDMFICDNFFNRPLDLALVIDPCRGDRGWFHWDEKSKDRIRRTGGFYLIGSRFRQAELESVASQLKGKMNMSTEYRSTGIAGSIGPQPAPVVNINDTGQSRNGLAILAIIGLQMIFLMVITWKLLFPTPTEGLDKLQAELAAIKEGRDYRQKLEVLETVLKFSGDSKVALAAALEEKETLRVQYEDSMAKRSELSRKSESLKREADNAETRLKDEKKRHETTREKLASAKSDLSKLKGDGSDGASGWSSPIKIGIMIAVCFAIGLGGGIAGFVLARVRGDDDDSFADDSAGVAFDQDKSIDSDRGESGDGNDSDDPETGRGNQGESP